MLEITDQLRHYGDAVAETVEAVTADDLTVMTAEPRRHRRPVWQPVAAAVVVLVLLAGGVWFATRSSDSSQSNGTSTSARDSIKVGVATVVVPHGMKLRSRVEVVGGGPKGSVTSETTVRVNTAAGTCTITDSRGGARNQWLRERNTSEVERFNAQLEGYAQLVSTLEARVRAFNEQLASLPPGSDQAPSIVSQRDAAVKQIDSANQQLFALTQAGPRRVPTGEGFTPTDAGRATWRAQATPRDVVEVTCPDSTTAQQLVHATTLPHP